MSVTDKEPVQSFDEYKSLSDQEKNFYIFSTLHAVKNGIEDVIKTLSVEVLDRRYDSRYAIKEIEIKVNTFSEQLASLISWRNIIVGMGILFTLIVLPLLTFIFNNINNKVDTIDKKLQAVDIRLEQ